MSIDWNTAPEGATHWEPAGLEFHEGWMKKEGNGWFFWGLDAEWKYGGMYPQSVRRHSRLDRKRPGAAMACRQPACWWNGNPAWITSGGA